MPPFMRNSPRRFATELPAEGSSGSPFPLRLRLRSFSRILNAVNRAARTANWPWSRNFFTTSSSPGGKSSLEWKRSAPVIGGFSDFTVKRSMSSSRPWSITTSSRTRRPWESWVFATSPWAMNGESNSLAFTGRRAVFPLVPSTIAWKVVRKGTGCFATVRKNPGVSVVPSTLIRCSTPLYFPRDSSMPPIPLKVPKSAWEKS